MGTIHSIALPHTHMELMSPAVPYFNLGTAPKSLGSKSPHSWETGAQSAE